MMSRLAWGLASSGRAILRIRASSVRISMAEYMSGMGMGNREIDLSHLEVPNSQIDPYWIDRLRRLRGAQKQTTIASLTKQLTPDNNLGFAHGKAIIDKGSFFEYATLQRELHRDKIILLRSGEFYETYGIDAVMLVALCGLNPMGGKCKAGCPIKNVQQTLDDLTDNGLSVAVYEEVAEPEVRPGPAPKVSKKKTRALTHIVTPATKTYPYELCLRSDEIAYSPNRPYVAIMGSVSGYDLYEIRLDEQLLLCTARLTEKGVETLLRTSGYAEPIFIQNAKLLQPTITSLQGGALVEELNGYSQSDFSNIVLRRVFAHNALDSSSLGAFRFVSGDVAGRPRCVYPMTQSQIGLSPNPNVPDLVEQLLPSNHAAHSARFLRRWLAVPPPPRVADQMQELVRRLTVSSAPLPSSLQPYPVGKVVSLLGARQANVGIFRDVLHCSASVKTMLEPTISNLDAQESGKSKEKGRGVEDNTTFEPLVPPLLALTSHETGVVAERGQFLRGCTAIVNAIRDVVQLEDQEDPPSFTSYLVELPSSANPTQARTKVGSLNNTSQNSYYELAFPWEFFENNEKEFRGRVRRDHPQLGGLYTRVEHAAKAFLEAIAEEFPPRLRESQLTYDFHNNLVYLSNKPNADEAVSGVNYEHPIDRKGAVLNKRYTTARVSAALAVYTAVVVGEAPKTVERVLQGLSATLAGEQMAIIHVANWAMVLTAAHAHTVSGLQKGWCLPELDEVAGSGAGFESRPMTLTQLSAYWMDRRDPITRTNDVTLGGMFLLTAPNMSGKSTLMRAVLVAALLANCGLMVPCNKAWVPRFESFSLRTSSYDVPIEGKSAFAMEIDDMRVVLRDCSNSPASLVMIDEIGKGTSSREGSVLAAAILEELVARKVTGIFATHLHEIFDLPGLRLDGCQLKRMGTAVVRDAETNRALRLESSFVLEDGICTDSLAVETARAVGGAVLAGVCDRAAELSALTAGPSEAKGAGADEELRLLRAENAQLKARLGAETKENTAGAAKVSRRTSTSSGIAAPNNILQSHSDDKVANVLMSATALAIDGLTTSTADQQVQPAATTATKTKTTTNRRQSSTILPSSSKAAYIIEELRETMRRLSGTRDGALLLESDFEPPAAYEGSAVVYLLLCTKGSEPPFLYVGETESILERLRTHRRKTFSQHSVTALVSKCPNKGAARLAETLLIKKLKAVGYDVRLDTDGDHRLFGAQQGGNAIE